MASSAKNCSLKCRGKKRAFKPSHSVKFGFLKNHFNLDDYKKNRPLW